MKPQSSLSQSDSMQSETRSDCATSALHMAAQSKSAIANEYHNFLTDIEDLIQATTSLTGEDLVHAKAALSQRINAAKESVEEVSGAVTDRARKSAVATNSYVHENPWQAIGVGAALGLILGVVVARR
jgi:ElaB/YqjD/DUF883 family membrane-anchored ribosome-binding protein